MNKSIFIREVGTREGFQTISRIVPTNEKIELIDALSDTGVAEIEIASFVRPDRLPQMADAEEIVSRYRRKPGVEYLGLYLNQKGFERAEQTSRLDNRGWIYSAASEVFLKLNNNTSSLEIAQSVPAWLDLFSRYRKKMHGIMVSTAFGFHGEPEITAEKVLEVLEGIVRAVTIAGERIGEISLADTVGLGVPEQVKRTVSLVKNKYPEIDVSLHLHDTRGAGLANAYAGYQEGVRKFESSVAGLGGCPFAPGASGNIVTEDLVALFETQGISTGINLDRYIAAAHLAERIIGQRLPGKIMREKRS